MSVVIGIDVGGSTTKIVGFRDNGGSPELIEPQLIKACDPLTSAYGAFGKFTDENKLKFSDISKVMITGVGSAYVKDSLYGLNCERVEEFNSIGLGGLYLSGLSEALVVSMGTGTAVVHANGNGKMDYLGGTGVGGGTIMGLTKLLVGAESVEHISEYAEQGSLENIDLRIQDITAQSALSELSRELTVANFGNVSDVASKSDIALGVMNMVFETVAMISIFAARSVGVKDIVLTGNVTKMLYCRERFSELEKMMAHYGVKFVTPEYSSFATVIGAAIRALSLI